MDEAKTIITKEQWLQAYALYTLACLRSKEASTLDAEAHKVMGVMPEGERHPNTWLSDAIYGGDGPTESDFADALKRLNIEVAV